ncbi:MAG: MFS transporter [Oscillospiraceae bacterium]|nr:MFS transporter [Oscillospiraceae bacterium]
MKTTAKFLDYKWIIVFISGLMVFTVLGFCSSANGIYIAPITSALDISRGSYAVTTSVRYVTTSVINIFFGTLIYRFGAKKLIMSGFILLIISSIIYSVATTVPIFCVGSFFLGAGLSFTTTTMVGSVINKWCAQNKGTIMGVVLATNGLGATLARIILTPIINAGNPFDYRNAYRLVAVILAGVALVMLIFFRNTPKGEEEHRYEVKKGKHHASHDVHLFRMPYFYVALVCIFVTGLVLQSVSGIADPHFRDNNVALATITTVMSVHSIVLSLSKFTTGFIYDKAGIRAASLICYLAAVFAMVSLVVVGNDNLGIFFGFVYAVLSSVALPLETIMLPIFARELFGDEIFNKSLGIFAAVNTAGYAVGGPIANLVFDITGSYDLWIFISIALIAAVCVTMNFVISAAKRTLAHLHDDEAVTAN